MWPLQCTVYTACFLSCAAVALGPCCIGWSWKFHGQSNKGRCLLNAWGMLELFDLHIAQVFALLRFSPRVSITINQPIALYELHSWDLICQMFTLCSSWVFMCYVGTNTLWYQSVKSTNWEISLFLPLNNIHNVLDMQAGVSMSS